KVLLPGDPLPGRSEKATATVNSLPLINDAGQIYLSPASPGGGTFLWDNGAVSVIAEADTQFPGFGKAVGTFTLAVNNKKNSAVVGAVVVKDGPRGIFLWDNGQFTPIILPEQVMPGGGIYHG